MATFHKTMSLHIPHVFTNITSEMIVQTFAKWDIGDVNHVDIVPKKGKNYNMAFVHLTWYENSLSAIHIQERIRNPSKVAKLVYYDPKYWILCEYKQKNETTMKNNLLVLTEYQDADDEEEDENGMTEKDYLRCEEFIRQKEEEETWEDYAKVTKDGMTLEDLIRCEEYLGKMEEDAVHCEEFIQDIMLEDLIRCEEVYLELC